MDTKFKLAIALVIMYAGFIIHFIYDEDILSKKNPEGPFPFRELLPLFCNVSNMICSLIVIIVFKFPLPKNIFQFLKVALPMFIGVQFSSYAKKYVDYATLNVYKSAKPLSVLLVSLLIFKKSVPIKKVIVVIMVTLGLILFGFTGQFQGSSFIGIILAGIALICDAIYVPMVDQLKSITSNSIVTMFYTYVWSTLFSSILSFRSFGNCFSYLIHQPVFTKRILILALTGSVAQIALFVAINYSDGLVVSIATTTRKFFTIVYSSIVYHHPFSLFQWIGVVIVFIALSLDMILKGPHQKHSSANSDIKGKIE